jgi:hypothetical protein
VEFGKRTPWDSVTKLDWVHKKAGTSTDARRRIIWQLQAITDMVRWHVVSPGELSINVLSGVQLGGHGMLDLVLFKLDLLDELLINQAGRCGLSVETTSKLLTVFESHESYRTHVGGSGDTTWMSTISPSAREFINIVGVGWPTYTHAVPSPRQSIMIRLPSPSNLA